MHNRDSGCWRVTWSTLQAHFAFVVPLFGMFSPLYVNGLFFSDAGICRYNSSSERLLIIPIDEAIKL